MSHHSQAIRHKRERQYDDSASIFAVGLITVGFSLFLSLVIFWPQKYSSDVFNSRLSYQTINNVENYRTCNEDYRNFIVDEMPPDDGKMSFYLFNVTNVRDVIQEGYKPSLMESGPYGYKKSTFKYNVTFDPNDDTVVNHMEYVELESISDDPSSCSETFFRMGRSDEKILNPCVDNICDCQSDESNVTVVNPSFFRTVHEETAPRIIGHLSGELFQTTRNILEKDFIVAVKAFTVHSALQEVYLFRTYMQVGQLLNASLTNLLQSHTFDSLSAALNVTATNVPHPPSCGLARFGIQSCPFYNMMDAIHHVQASTVFTMGPIPNSLYPSLKPLLTASNNISIFNLETGLPAWIGLTYYFRFLDFNFALGYTMASDDDFYTMHMQIAAQLAVHSFGTEHGSDARTLFAAKVLVKAVAYYLATYWLRPFESFLISLVRVEWVSSYVPVACDPLGRECVWQFGYMGKHRGNAAQLSDLQVKSLIDSKTVAIGNPNNIAYDGNAAAYYNTHTYCSESLSPTAHDSCRDVDYTRDDALVQTPSGLWGVDYGYSNANRTKRTAEYSKQSESLKREYHLLGCNVSALQYEVYAKATPFHDLFTVKYLNAHADPLFTHQFDVSRLEELAWAQYGGGFVTYALLSVRSTFQIIRNGMWRYADAKYYSAMLEYGSWAIFAGFPSHVIYEVSEARTLLHAMSDTSPKGSEFRRHIVAVGTTLIGDGVHFTHGVGLKGEVAYTPESNLGDFSCEGEMQQACALLVQYSASSVDQCNTVQSFYNTCIRKLYFDLSRWVTNCARFVTSMTDPTNGIPCSSGEVYGHAHPYRKSRGNVMYSMIQAYTSELSLKRGLWCNPVIDPGSAYSTSSTGLQSAPFAQGAAACTYDLGGMFVRVAVKHILFEGYTDPSVVKYLNAKHAHDNVRFECMEHPLDRCGELLSLSTCSSAGIALRLPDGRKHALSYSRSKDEYFAPYFILTAEGRLIWPYSANRTLALTATHYMASNSSYIKIRNPVHAAHPGMTSGDKAYNKHRHEQGRVLGGEPDLFNSPYDTLDTGRKDVRKSSSLLKFKGNSSITHLPTTSPMREGGRGGRGRGEGLKGVSMKVIGSTSRTGQQAMGLWSAFYKYPYSWLGLSEGMQFFQLTAPTLFSKQLGLALELSQQSFLTASEDNIAIVIPIPDSPSTANQTKSLHVQVRRFVEVQSTWDQLRALGVPLDTYGMPYTIPQGMASLEYLAGFPIFAGTPNNWGNKEFGGLEFQMVQGLVPEQAAQWTFLDYEPVTGRAIRSALRQQLNVRVETGPLFMSAFTGQGLCVPPNKVYSASSGYGCFAYIPMLWTEDARVVNTEEFFRLNDNFYTRPYRARALIMIGSAFTVFFVSIGCCILIHDNVKKRRIIGRIYVD